MIVMPTLNHETAVSTYSSRPMSGRPAQNSAADHLDCAAGNRKNHPNAIDSSSLGEGTQVAFRLARCCHSV